MNFKEKLPRSLNIFISYTSNSNDLVTVLNKTSRKPIHLPYAKEFTHNGLGQHFKNEDKTITNTENPVIHFKDGISVNLATNIVSNEDYAFNYLFSKM